MDKLKLSHEEQVIINQVKRDVHYYRCLPFGLGCIVGCHFLMRRGIISTSKPFMKYAIFGISGYIVGSFSFPAMIRDRILTEAPDGNFAQTLKTLQQLPPEERQEFLNKTRVALQESVSSTTSTSQTQPQPLPVQDNISNTNIFTQSNQPNSQQSETTSQTSDEDRSQKQFSYREQRSRNNTSIDGKFKQPIESNNDKIPPSKNVQRNKYGDEME